ncbi:hypothetical protein D9M73_288470 [compost metagenome]
MPICASLGVAKEMPPSTRDSMEPVRTFTPLNRLASTPTPLVCQKRLPLWTRGA